MRPSDYIRQLADFYPEIDRPLTLDFETFYDTEDRYSLRYMSIEEYVRDPRFHVHGLSVKLGDAQGRWLAGEGRVAEFLTKVPMDKLVLTAHNARFDGFILSEIYGLKPMMWTDTLSMAAMVGGNNVGDVSLAGLARRFLPANMRKDKTALVNVDGKRDLTREEMKALGVYAVQDVDLCRALFNLFYPAFKNRPLELPILDMVIRMFTDPGLELDVELFESINETEAAEKAAAVENCIAPDLKALRSNPQLAALLEGCGVDVPMKRNAKGDETYAFAKTDRDFVELTMHPDKTVRDLVNARLRVKSSIEETRAASYAAVGRRGNWPVALNMSGARTTHRLSGSADGGGNPQNLTNVNKSRLRLGILPPKGHHLLVIDSSGIDLRCAMHLAGEEEVCEQWKDPDFDLYVAFAAYLFNCKLSEVTPEQRKLGKVAVLSLQYKAGGDTFRAMAWQRGVELSRDEAAAVVAKYRTAFTRITRAWEALNFVLRRLARGEVENTWMDRLVIANPNTVAGCPGFDVAGGMPITYPHLGFEYVPEFGRNALMYTTYEKHKGGGDEEQIISPHKANRPVRNTIHGGKAFGHICQNAARNIVMPQTVAIERWLKDEVHRDCKSVASVHDEGIYIIPNASFKSVTPDDVLQGALEIMRTPPDWWPEITLNAGAGIGECSYGEIEH